MNSKSSFRQSIRQQLREVSPYQLDQCSTKICEHLSEFIRHSELPLSNIAIFSSHGKEVDLASLHLLHPSAKLLYPLCHAGGILSFHHVDDVHELSTGTLGILEPSPDIHPTVDLSHIDLFVCPGLAFGIDGSRLGHGGGYYDRALTHRSPTAQAIGVAMDCQIFDTVPHASHDIYLDRIFCESFFIAEGKKMQYEDA